MKFFLSRYVVSVALTVSLGTLLCTARGEETKSLEDFPSTPHFWYRPQPPGPYIDCQRANKAFGYLEGKILLSEDNARTWPHSAAFPDAKKITFSHILKNGNILFATGANRVLSARLREVVAGGGVDFRSTLWREGDRCGGTDGQKRERAWKR